MKKFILLIFSSLLFFILGWWSQTLYSFEEHFSLQTTLDKIKQKRRLDVIILNSPTVYYVGSEGKMGFEYELISSYAKDLGVELNLRVVSSVEEALELSKKGLGDITVAGLNMSEERKKQFVFGPKYYVVQEQMICHKDMYRQNNFPLDMKDLSGLRIVVGESTSYEQALKNLTENHPEMKIDYESEYSTEQLLEMVWKKEIDCTVADSNLLAINQRYYPELAVAFSLSDRKYLGWVLREGDSSLKDDLKTWIKRCEQAGRMTELIDYYYSYLDLFDYYDTRVFHKRLKSRLPKYEKHFKQSAQENDIPWTLLAAQSYQESHWDEKARSYTGVRGLMMLTLTTANQLGITNRLDPKESIYGGARYIAQIEKSLEDEIKGHNRIAFALAAYNVGMGHIHDAQTLARRMNKDPYSWRDIKTVLPLLSQKKYYKQLKYGYARGSEPVRYVSSIEKYADILNQKLAKD